MSNNNIVIINYGMGNLRSVYNKFRKLNIETKISDQIDDINNASKLVLPGVGHFKTGMQQLEQRGLLNILNKKVIEDETPIMGICLGTQLFCNHSEEGDGKGLGWIDADVIKFKVSDTLKYKVPHMGWNTVNVINHNSLDEPISEDEMFYFVHSFHLKCNVSEDIWMTSKYDYEFVSAVHKNNIFGTQFHPEKSHDVGFKLLQKFAEL